MKEVSNIICTNSRLKALNSTARYLAYTAHSGRIGQAVKLVDFMTFNLGFHSKFILKPLMHAHYVFIGFDKIYIFYKFIQNPLTILSP